MRPAPPRCSAGRSTSCSTRRRNLARLDSIKDIKVVHRQEDRIVFLGFDQHRDELLYSNVKGRNPSKDVRVRQAVYHAIDIEAIRTRMMRGAALPIGGITPSMLASNPDAEKRLPYDPQRARRLLADAGYPNGFAVTLVGPNNTSTTRRSASRWRRC